MRSQAQMNNSFEGKKKKKTTYCFLVLIDLYFKYHWLRKSDKSCFSGEEWKNIVDWQFLGRISVTVNHPTLSTFFFSRDSWAAVWLFIQFNHFDAILRKVPIIQKKLQFFFIVRFLSTAGHDGQNLVLQSSILSHQGLNFSQKLKN